MARPCAVPVIAFGSLFTDLQGRYPYAHLPVEPAAAVVASLKALGAAMVDQARDPGAGQRTPAGNGPRGRLPARAGTGRQG